MTRWLGFAGIAIALLTGLVLPARADEPSPEAQKAVESWIALIDGAKLNESWTDAHPMFKEKVSKEDWVTAITGLSGRVGKVKSRKLHESQTTKSLPNLPDGDYAVFVYDSSYEKLDAAIDTLVAARDKDGAWRVAGYFIRPEEKP